MAVAVAASGSPFHFIERTAQAHALKDSMDSHVKGQGLFFALWDPAGITQEINTEQVLAYGAAMAPYERKLWAASAIEGLQTAIEEGAEEDENAAAEQLKGQTAESYALYSLFDGGKAYERQVQSIDAQKDREMESVKTAAWEPYTKSYSPNAVKQFRNDMKNQMKQVEASTLNPIADDHVAWLKSTALKTVFAFDYHEHDLVKGVDYAELFHSCIAYSADRKQVYDLILQWAQGDVMDRHSPLLRSLVLNHDPTAEKVKEAAGFPLAELREPLAKLIESNNVSNEILEKEEGGLLLRADKAAAGILHEVGGACRQLYCPRRRCRRHQGVHRLYVSAHENDRHLQTGRRKPESVDFLHGTADLRADASQPAAKPAFTDGQPAQVVQGVLTQGGVHQGAAIHSL